MEPTTVLGTSIAAVGILISVLCIPLILGKIPMNSVYGFRFERSMESSEAWYKINQYGARILLAWSLALAAVGILLLFVPVRRGSLPFFIALNSPIVLLIPAIQSYRYAKALPPAEDSEENMDA